MDAKCRFFWSRKCKGLPLGGNRIIVEDASCAQEPIVPSNSQPSCMYSVWDGQARLVTVTSDDQESVYQLDTGEFVTEVTEREQFGEGEFGTENLILVSSGGNIMLGGEGDVEDDQENE